MSSTDQYRLSVTAEASGQDGAIQRAMMWSMECGMCQLSYQYARDVSALRQMSGVIIEAYVATHTRQEYLFWEGNEPQRKEIAV